MDAFVPLPRSGRDTAIERGVVERDPLEHLPGRPPTERTRQKKHQPDAGDGAAFLCGEPAFRVAHRLSPKSRLKNATQPCVQSLQCIQLSLRLSSNRRKCDTAALMLGKVPHAHRQVDDARACTRELHGDFDVECHAVGAHLELVEQTQRIHTKPDHRIADDLATANFESHPKLGDLARDQP